VQHATMRGHDIDNLPADLMIHLGCPPGSLALRTLYHASFALALQRVLIAEKRPRTKRTAVSTTTASVSIWYPRPSPCEGKRTRGVVLV
jgi:hypothetical protein